MSFIHGSGARVYANGFDLSGFFKKISSSFSVDTHETTTFTATAKSYIAGLEDATLTAEGLFSGAAGATDVVLQAALRGRAPVLWNWYPSGDTDGAWGYGFLAIHTSYEIESPVDDVVSVSAEAQSVTGQERVQVLAPLSARTVTANGTGRDNAAATSAGGAGYLQVTSATGTSPNLVAKIQHSTDGSTWVDLITFTTVTGSNQAQRIAVTGTVNRHVRAIWTITGTTPNFTFNVAFARN